MSKDTTEAISEIATALQRLGNGAANSKIWAVENLGMVIKNGNKETAASMDGIAAGLNNIANAINNLAQVIAEKKK